MDFAEIVLSLYWVCACRCLVTVSNPVSIALRIPYWFSLCRLDFDVRLVKNVMHAPAQPVWPEWLAQNLGLRRLKTFTRFLQSISCSPSGETICMQGALSYDLICCSELTRSICELTHLAGQLWQMASTLRLNNGRLWMQVGFMHTDERLSICSFESVQVISAKTKKKNELSTFDLDVFPSHIHKLPAPKPVGRIVSIFHYTSKSPFSCSSKVSLQGKRNFA